MAAKRRLQNELSNLKMEIGEDPTKYMLLIDDNIMEQQRPGVKIEEYVRNNIILNGLTNEYDVTPEVLDGEEEITKNKLLSRIRRSYARLQEETVDGGGVALMARTTLTVPKCQRRQKTDHSAKTCWNREIREEKKEESKDRRHNGSGSGGGQQGGCVGWEVRR